MAQGIVKNCSGLDFLIVLIISALVLQGYLKKCLLFKETVDVRSLCSGVFGYVSSYGGDLSCRLFFFLKIQGGCRFKTRTCFCTFSKFNETQKNDKTKAEASNFHSVFS